MRDFLRTLWRNFLNFLYNEDRAIASLAGAPAQETISSEIGRHAQTDPAAKVGAEILDSIQKDHVETAVAHADKLEARDDGEER